MKELVKKIPNGITLINLSLGFSAILLNDPFLSPLLILFASFGDLFDGLLARILDARSALGEQLDSLSDLISFGMAPAFLYYHYCLQGNWWDIVIICLFPSFAALRLAVFNLDDSQHNTFRGLATPAAGLFLAFFVFGWVESTGLFFNYWVLLIIPLFFSFLMLSKIRMFSLKNPMKQSNLRKSLFVVLGLVGIVLLGMIQFKSIPLIVLLYIVLSLVENIITQIKNSI